MTTKTIRFSDRELDVIGKFARDNDLTFSAAVKTLIVLNSHSDYSAPGVYRKKTVENKPLTIRLYRDDLVKLTEVAESKGITVPQEIRFRISSTMGTSLYDMNEAKDLLSVANDISKVGRLINQSLKERLLLGTRVTAELSKKIDELDSGLKKLVVNTMRRIK